LHKHFGLLLYGVFNSISFGFGFELLHLSFAPASVEFDILDADVVQAVRTPLGDGTQHRVEHAA